MQQDGVQSLQSDKESLEEKLSPLVIGRDRSDSVAHYYYYYEDEDEENEEVLCFAPKLLGNVPR